MHKTLYQRNPVKGFIYFQHLHIDFSNKCFYNEHMFEISSDLTTKEKLEILADADARIKQSAADGRTVLEVTILRLIELLRRERA